MMAVFILLPLDLWIFFHGLKPYFQALIQGEQFSPFLQAARPAKCTDFIFVVILRAIGGSLIKLRAENSVSSFRIRSRLHPNIDLRHLIKSDPSAFLCQAKYLDFLELRRLFPEANSQPIALNKMFVFQNKQESPCSGYEWRRGGGSCHLRFSLQDLPHYLRHTPFWLSKLV